MFAPLLYILLDIYRILIGFHPSILSTLQSQDIIPLFQAFYLSFMIYLKSQCKYRPQIFVHVDIVNISHQLKTKEYRKIGIISILAGWWYIGHILRPFAHESKYKLWRQEPIPSSWI